MKSKTAIPSRDRTSVTRRFVGLLRRRFPWVMLSGLVAVTATTAAVLKVEPAYRATMTLMLEDRTLPLDFDPGELQQYAGADVRARSERVLAREALVEPVGTALDIPGADLDPLSARSFPLVERIGIGGIDAEITPPTTGDLSRVSFAFTATLDDPDPAGVERVMRAVQTRFLVDDQSSGTASSAATLAVGLATNGAEVDRLAQTVAELESEIEAFERQNAAGLPELYELNAQAMERADRERAQLDGQILALEERRMDLDRALRDIERDAAEDRAGEEVDPLTSQRLVALQSERAVLAGLYGAEHPEAQQLGAEIDELQRTARERLDRASSELRDANEQLARLERIHTIDHPDVVRLAHQVSALESRIDEVTLTGLTAGERRYIEGLASERRDIDGRLDTLGSRQETLRESVADYESRALERPRLEQQYGGLKEQLVQVRADYEAAQTQRDELVFEQRIAEQSTPGRLTVVEPLRVYGPLLMTRPTVVTTLGVIFGLLGIFAVVLLVERLDRRVSGARRIEELQGVPPLAEIPFIRISNQASAAPELIPGLHSVAPLVGVLSVLLMTGFASEEMGQVMLGILGL